MSNELERWADAMAARNQTPLDWITPVLLYRDGAPALMGASALYEDQERIFTAAHGFSVDYRPWAWTFRKLIPSGSPARPLTKAVPLRGPEDDVAVCTPASAIELAGGRLTNFYRGYRRGSGILTDWRVVSTLQEEVRSVLTGERIALVAEVFFEGRVHILLDYQAREGESGTVFVSEEENALYVLRAYSTSFAAFVRDRHPDIARAVTRGTTFALRLRYE